MQRFVFWTGVYNVVAGACFLFPGFVKLIGVSLPSSDFWLWFPAAAVIYLGVLLILCSRNLPARAPLVYWEGILRIVAFFLFGGFGFFGGLGIMLGVIGTIDLVFGLIYLVGLPIALRTGATNLLLDRAG